MDRLLQQLYLKPGHLPHERSPQKVRSVGRFRLGQTVNSQTITYEGGLRKLYDNDRQGRRSGLVAAHFEENGPRLKILSNSF